jgi:hypothetical protein
LGALADICYLLTGGKLTLQILANNALLTLSRLYCLPIALRIDRRESLSGCQTLLALQNSALNPCAITTKCACANSISLLLRKLLALLLLQSCLRRTRYIVGVGVHVIANLTLR